jgi:SAM-dependent methyltransferase
VNFFSREPNLYSQRWFEFFHSGIDETRTTKETDFVCRCAPLPEFHKIVDLCCGMGRHARALTARGYSVTGVDRDTDAIAKARELGGGANYIAVDLRDYRPEPRAFDVAIVMGQSFGYFDATTNRDLLRRLAESVRERGRVILDLWSPEFFVVHQGERELSTPRGLVREIKHVENDRLFVRLDYPDGTAETFEWQLLSSAELTQLAELVGLDLLFSCAHFDVTNSPSVSAPRAQFVFERRRM